MRSSHLGLTLCVALTSAMGCQRSQEAPARPQEAPVAAIPLAAPTAPTPRVGEDVTYTGDVPQADEAEVAEDGPPKPVSPEDRIAAMETALEGVLRCPRAPGGLRVANPAECLRPLQRARGALARSQDNGDADASMRRELSELLVRAASREDPTLILYALKHHEGDFGDGEEARRILEKRMNDRRMDIAVAAATARLHQLKREDSRGLSLAREYLMTSERPDRLRVVCCAALGSTGFAGEREHIDLLLALAGDKEESALVRGCAAQHLGNLGTPADVSALAALLKEPVVQSDTVSALITGMGTTKAYSTVVRWLGKQVKRPALLQASTISRLLPPEDKMADFPLNKLTKPLQGLITDSRAPVATRLAAVDTLTTVSTERQARCQAKASGKACPSPVGTLDALLAKTSSSTQPNDLRVRSRLSRAKAALPKAETGDDKATD